MNVSTFPAYGASWNTWTISQKYTHVKKILTITSTILLWLVYVVQIHVFRNVHDAFCCR